MESAEVINLQPIMSETKHQIILVDWCEIQNIPIVAIANQGHRSGKSGAILKHMGLRRGFPDLFCPSARGGYFGMFLEMKQNRKYRKSETNTKHWIEQDAWLIFLKDAGFYAKRAFGWEQGKEIIQEYFCFQPTSLIA